MMRSFAGLIIGLVLIVGAGFAGATTIHVRADGLGDYPTIQAAINAAQDGDEIELADGTYVGAGNRDLDYLGKALTVLSASADPTACVLDLQATEADKHRGISFHTSETSASMLKGVTIMHGHGQEIAEMAGSALFIDGASPTIVNCRFVENTGVGTFLYVYSGGAAVLVNSNAHFDDCVFVDNSGRQGGAVVMQESAPLFENCTFEGNSALSAGGAVAVVPGNLLPDTTGPVFLGCDFLTNEAATSGGAIHASGMFQGQTSIVVITISACDFASNVAGANQSSSSARGGAIFLVGVHATVGEPGPCHFSNNVAKLQGGAICAGGRQIAIRNCTFAANRAGEVADPECPPTMFSGTYGGAIELVAPPSYTDLDAPEPRWIEVTDCSFTANEASHGGGLALGTWIASFEGGPVLKNTDIRILRNTFVGNQGYLMGGGLWYLIHYGTQTYTGLHEIKNNIFQGNHATPGLPFGVNYVPLGGGGLSLYGYNDILRVSENEIFENTSTGAGGGVLAQSFGGKVWDNFIYDNVVDVDASDAAFAEHCSCNSYYCEPYPDERWKVARGGGVAYLEAPSILEGNTVVNNTVTGTNGAGGGGIALWPYTYPEDEGTHTVVRNNVVAGNSSTGEGGGIHLELWDVFPEDGKSRTEEANAEIVNNTLVLNEAASGGGLYVWRETQLGRVENNIVRGNLAPSGGGIAGGVGGPVTPARYAYNDVYQNTTGDWSGFPLDQPTNYGNTGIDPLFQDWTAYQGDPSRRCDLMLKSGSTLNNLGNPTQDMDCDGSRNAMGAFGGPALCGEAPWVINVVKANQPGCMVRYTWQTTLATNCEFYSRRRGTGVWVRALNVVDNGTQHEVTISYTHMLAYDVKIVAVVAEEEWQPCPVYDTFKLPCVGIDTETAGAGATVLEGGIRIAFSAAQAGEAEIALYDVAGRQVRSLTSYSGSPGQQVAWWDGKDQQGARVPSGVYVFRVRGTVGDAVGKVMVLK